MGGDRREIEKSQIKRRRQSLFVWNSPQDQRNVLADSHHRWIGKCSFEWCRSISNGKKCEETFFLPSQMEDHDKQCPSVLCQLARGQRNSRSFWYDGTLISVMDTWSTARESVLRVGSRLRCRSVSRRDSVGKVAMLRNDHRWVRRNFRFRLVRNQIHWHLTQSAHHLTPASIPNQRDD